MTCIDFDFFDIDVDFVVGYALGCAVSFTLLYASTYTGEIEYMLSVSNAIIWWVFVVISLVIRRKIREEEREGSR